MRCRFTFVDTVVNTTTTYRFDGDAALPHAHLVAALQAHHPTLSELWCADERLDPDVAIASGPLCDGVILHGMKRAPEPSQLSPQAPGSTVSISAGPDAGLTFTVPTEGLVVGRGPDADLVVNDRTVSPRHARLTPYGAHGVAAFDLDSRNGLVVDGVRVSGEVRRGPGEVVRLGMSQLRVGPCATSPAFVEEDTDGAVRLHRHFRIEEPRPRVTLLVPIEPKPPERTAMPWAAALLPPLAGIAMAVVMRNPLFLMFAFMGPLMLVANEVTQRRRRSRVFESDQLDYVTALAACRSAAAEAVRVDLERRRADAPDPAQVLATAVQRSTRLWERRPGDADALSLRVGIGDQPVAIDFDRRGQTPSEGVVAHDAPVCVNLAEVGVLGVAGAPAAVAAHARWLVAQMSTLHGPDDVRIAIVCAGPAAVVGSAGWAWTRWLPHLRHADQRLRFAPDVGEVETGDNPRQGQAILDELTAHILAVKADEQSANHRPRATHVVVLDGVGGLRGHADIATVLRAGPAAGVFVICLDTSSERLAEECRAVIEFEAGSDPGLVEVRIVGRAPHSAVIADTVPAEACEALARSLAPLRALDPATTRQLPTSVRLLDLCGAEPPTAGAVRAGWSMRNPSMNALLGVAADGPFEIDIEAKGPHALIAGTTGAGKSELLKTMIVSLALRNRPDALQFVLVDYKGGSAFADCAELPHTVGVVTDLDPTLVERALTSLQAELKRREHELARVGASQLSEYLDVLAADPSLIQGAPLARLMLVIDEFAMLATELPDFVHGLVGIARVGRTLGIHLVLATQRPSGVVSPEIRANTNLRIALRVASAAESNDVIERRDAALISEAHRGRAFALAGHELFVEFQSAHVGGPRPNAVGAVTGSGHATLRIRPEPWSEANSPWPVPTLSAALGGPRNTDLRATDLRAIVRAIDEAARIESIDPPPSPWLAALPDVVTIDHIALEGNHGHAPVPQLVFGLEDVPDQQRQTPAVLALGGEHLAIAGSARSGRSTLLRALGAQIARNLAPAQCQLYVLDLGSGALAPLRNIPHCGALITRSEVERGARLIAALEREVARRARILERSAYADVQEQWRAGAPDALPYIVVLIDRWETFVDTYRELDGGAVERALYRLLADGPAAGLTAVVSGDRTVFSFRLAPLVEHKLVLDLHDPSDAALADLRPKQIPPNRPPGRAVRGGSGRQLQVALLDPDPSGAAQGAALHRIAIESTKRFGADSFQEPIRVDDLPNTIDFDRARALDGHGSDSAPLVALVGVGGDRLAPVHVSLDEVGAFVVLGPPRSGRSNALAALADSLHLAGATVISLSTRRSPLTERRGAAPPGADLANLAATAATVDGPVCVLIDDLDQAPGDHEGLRTLLRSRRPDTAIVVSTTIEDARTNLRGLLPELLRARSGLLLSPSSAADGMAFGLTLARSAAFNGPPGRALLAERGSHQLVQIPLVGAPPATFVTLRKPN